MFAVQAVTLVYTNLSKSKNRAFGHATTVLYLNFHSLKKLKKILPFHIKKNLAQALVLSKLYCNDIVYHPLPDYLSKRLQCVQKATASFILGDMLPLKI